jgi:short-subunit dehydrogenase
VARYKGALVIGASSGIGAALARQLVDEGYRVGLVARRQQRLEALTNDLNGASAEPVAFAYSHDVADFAATPALFAHICQDLAPLQLVVYAAGVMPRVVTGASFADERTIVETNLVGAMCWLGLAANWFESQGNGALVGISSVAGDRGRPGNGAYMASKAALSTYLDSLRFRLAPSRVKVVTIKPGYVATPMTAGLKLPRPLTLTPEDVARRISRAIKREKRVAYIPGYWAMIMRLVRGMPAAAVARMPG